MTNTTRVGILAAASAALVMGGCLTRLRRSPQEEAAGAAEDRRVLAEAVIAQWSSASALTARRMGERHGIPDEVQYDRMVWDKIAPWKRTVVWDVRTRYADTSAEDVGIIEQTIAAALTPAQAADVAAFDPRVAYDEGARTLSVRSDREELNFLRMNLAHDVILGRLTPDAARRSFASITDFEKAGRTSPYLKGLTFAVWTEESP